MTFDWNTIDVVIFDVDGTLYNQSRLRRQMTRSLLSHYALRPWQAYDLQVIRIFRKEREKMCLDQVSNLEEAQYQRCAQKINVAPQKVKQIISKWMYQAPLPHLQACSYPGIQMFFNAMKKRGIKIAIYSDYPATDKLAAMGLEADLVVASTDESIDALKPNPAGLSYILTTFNTTPERCLFFGDRDELDGACARQAGMPYYILTETDKQTNFYSALAESVATPQPV
ncbi:HAD family hydrolase [Cesiribacter andamanensis]|uniref:phosphoglycolate phosphatase n=1 Tax=Cesiribacter andamanensis AMV16 TaxID=1279009 RepID=M7MZK8_9BACT|nr:HAD family hydrolase [Cesiribacter andamanensis]EMR01858.1 phosphoglycolate phosphatase [Cesiribacter andamanensis AMV16]